MLKSFFSDFLNLNLGFIAGISGTFTLVICLYSVLFLSNYRTASIEFSKFSIGSQVDSFYKYPFHQTLYMIIPSSLNN